MVFQLYLASVLWDILSGLCSSRSFCLVPYVVYCEGRRSNMCGVHTSGIDSAALHCSALFLYLGPCGSLLGVGSLWLVGRVRQAVWCVGVWGVYILPCMCVVGGVEVGVGVCGGVAVFFFFC